MAEKVAAVEAEEAEELVEVPVAAATEYDDLPLDTPTMIAEDDNVEVWATRTANGGTVEQRVKPGSAAARAGQLDALLDSAIAANKAFIDTPNATLTNPQVVAQVKALTRQVNAMLRLQRNAVDVVD